MLAVVEAARGATDEEVTTIARVERRLLITEDWGFGEKAVRLGALPDGVVLAGCQAMSLHEAAERVAMVLGERGERLREHVTVVQPEKVRARVIRRSSIRD